jgi:hypothetical protein
MFSLCIPTIDRFDLFLSIYLPQYIDNDLINEIIITDENGNDIEKIDKTFPNNEKLILVKNETKLGPFLNKLKACSYAKNEWISIMDSDNFADKNYFITGKEYIQNIEKNNINKKNIILAPFKANPHLNYSHLSGYIYNKGNIQNNRNLENNIFHYSFWNPTYKHSEVLMNTGNYIINKYLIEGIDLSQEAENIKKSSACDVIYFNTLLFEQLDLHMHIVPNLEYEHVVHEGSTYTQTHQEFSNFNEIVHNRYRALQ